MPASSLIRNNQLFSEVYLRELQIAKGPVDHLAACRKTIREWRDELPSLEREPDLRLYTEQCLSALGVAYSARAAGGGWTLFSDAAKAQPTALCLAVSDEDLGRAVKGRHHQARLVRQLRDAGLHWGLLTNGLAWRLCHASGPAPYEQWMEADLDALLGTQDFAGFRIFHRFFGVSAVAERPYDPPPPPLAKNVPLRIGLDDFLAESERRTVAVERHLKGRVEPILQRLCLGFVRDEGAEHYTREALDEIYRNAIYLLYRVLFLFYAEARELLPVHSPLYQPHSLAAIVESARRRQEEGVRDPDPHSLWKRLDELCGVVDLGSDEWGVAAYNGGLFNRAEKKYLSDHRLSDDYLAPSLYDLAFESAQPAQRGRASTSAGGTPQLIDYRDLSVRHLGTLYEGMLEYRLNRVSREPRVVREAGSARRYVPLSEAGAVKKGETVLEVGEVYFADDKGERKSSGSYYTPEDVVQYIVTNTVGPKLEECRAALYPVLDEARRAREIAATADERARMERYADSKTLETVQDHVLRLRILDPAMGSGHFLVAAGQLVADFCVETLNLTEWPGELSTDPRLWKRRVVERCLYGVDKNPLAVELAKLALWIASASEDKPLTYLDHHLKCGNSLYGTPLSRMGSLPTAKKEKDDSLFRLAREAVVKEALQRLGEVSVRDSDDMAAVKEKSAAHRSAQVNTQRLRDVANVWLASLFGLEGDGGKPITEAEYDRLLGDVTTGYAPSQWEARVAGSRALQQAREIAEREEFFHWELEFPEAFVAGRCRFDAVVANPPYVKTQTDKAITALFQTARCNDLFAWIFERSVDLLCPLGIFGTVVPLSVMFAGDKRSLRSLLKAQPVEVSLVSCDNTPDSVFGAPGAELNRQRVTIVSVRKANISSRVRTTDHLRWSRSERPYVFSNLRFADTTDLASERYFPTIGDQELASFMKRLTDCGHAVRDLVDPDGTEFLCVPSVACYFISAVPVNLNRRNQELLYFKDEATRKRAFSILNSNVFYWYWRSRSDGFWVSRDQVLSMPIPASSLESSELVTLADELWDGAVIEQSKRMGDKVQSNYYFDKRMDILQRIDHWIVSQVAPELTPNFRAFAAAKSHSFLNLLDLNPDCVPMTESEGGG